MKKRRYTLKRRAERQEATRKRIVEAAVALHERLGPAATTISAIADRAGVQRLTVYRHFPDEARLLEACSSTWFERNLPPDPSGWADRADPAERTRRALERLYAYYRRTAPMLTSVTRDLDAVPGLPEIMSGFDAYLEGVRTDLLAAWKETGDAPDPRRTKAILGHALRLSTWTSLAAEKLSDKAMAAAIAAWITGLSPGRQPARGHAPPVHDPA